MIVLRAGDSRNIVDDEIIALQAALRRAGRPLVVNVAAMRRRAERWFAEACWAAATRDKAVKALRKRMATFTREPEEKPKPKSKVKRAMRKVTSSA